MVFFITWKSKKKTVVARSSVEVEYRDMAQMSCELMWLKHFLEELMYEVPLLICIVIIRLPYTLLPIPCFMRGLNILRLIVISFMRELRREC